MSADDQQCRGDHVGERSASEVGPAAAGHHRANLHPRIGGRDQGRAGTGAGAEIADGQRRGIGLAGQPAGDVGQPASQQLDVEDVGAVAFLGRGEQVEQQGGEPGLVQDLGDIPVAGAVPAASAAVREHHDAPRVLGNGQVPGHLDQPDGHPDFLIAQRRVGGADAGDGFGEPSRARSSSAITSSSEGWVKLRYP